MICYSFHMIFMLGKGRWELHQPRSSNNDLREDWIYAWTKTVTWYLWDVETELLQGREEIYSFQPAVSTRILDIYFHRFLVSCRTNKLPFSRCIISSLRLRVLQSFVSRGSPSDSLGSLISVCPLYMSFFPSQFLPCHVHLDCYCHALPSQLAKR